MMGMEVGMLRGFQAKANEFKVVFHKANFLIRHWDKVGSHIEWHIRHVTPVIAADLLKVFFRIFSTETLD